MSKDSRRDRHFARHTIETKEDISFSEENDYLPLGIAQTKHGALCAERLLEDCHDAVERSLATGEPVKVAVFDFDGTCIDTSSPRRLVMSLWLRNLITLYKAVRLGFWGIAYKLNLPRNEEAVRIRVFSAFKGRPASVINKYLANFFFKKIEPEYLPEADASMIAHLEEGHIVVIASATFEPILAAAMTVHPIQFSLSTRMRIDEDGKYTDQIEGLPANGSDKVVVLREFLDSMFSECGWEFEFAYADHFSDIPMLEQAAHPCAVDPDPKLRRYAEAQGWDIVDWEKHED